MKDSAYNLCVQDRDGTYYLFNTRRGTVQVITARAYEAYWAAANRAGSLEDASETLRELRDKGFLVENDTDELSEIQSAHGEARQSREQLDLVITPSMACNLDCPYCFETNRYPGRMSGEVQANIVRLVRRYFASGTKRLSVTWYGGEPLLALSVVERLSRQFLALCEGFGRGYSAEIVTNGTLMTAEKAQRLAAWKVKRAQITLDGVPELHDERRVAKNRRPTFSRILKGIDAAAAQMDVSIRINMCRKIAARLQELLQMLAARGLNRTTTVYVAPLQQAHGRKPPSRGEPETLAPASISPEGGEPLDLLDGEESADLALRFDGLLWKHGFPVTDRLPQPRCTICMADREHSWLIEANGDVQKCYWNAGLGAEAVGRLTAEGIVPRGPYRKWQEWTAFRNADCLHCVMVPICLGRCPLKHLNNESDYCPAFKHKWISFLTRAAKTGHDSLAPVRLRLAGEKVAGLTLQDR